MVCVMQVLQVGNRLTFTVGKADLYVDFDGTYCPAKHSSLHNPNANVCP